MNAIFNPHLDIEYYNQLRELTHTLSHLISSPILREVITILIFPLKKILTCSNKEMELFIMNSCL